MWELRKCPTGEVGPTGAEHGGTLGRRLWCDKRVREVRVVASESPESLERLRERFLLALSELSGRTTG